MEIHMYLVVGVWKKIINCLINFVIKKCSLMRRQSKTLLNV